jgi:hypothetical protein
MNEKSHTPSGKPQKGWWSRFLDRLIKANKEAPRQGCMT